MNIHTIGIVGSGQMGSGIGQVAAHRGFDVILYDISEEIVNRALGNISRGLTRLAERGKLTPEEPREILARLQGTADLGELSRSDIVIEAAPEDHEIKKEIFQHLDQVTRPEVI